MSEPLDSIVIGAGIIGAATTLALSRCGRRVLCLDRLPAAGYGSTSGSCAIIRPYYSTVEGSALAYESHFYWKNWESFVGVADERGLARYIDCGCLVMETEQNQYLQPARDLMDAIGAPWQALSAREVQDRLPFVCLDSFAPARLADDPEFGEPNGARIGGAVFFPSGGYVNDPQLATHNLQRAAEAAGAEFRFNCEVAAIVRDHDRVSGVRLRDGTELRAPVLVNVAGPHSSKVNDLAAVMDDRNIATRALRHEVAHVPAPEGVDFDHDGCVVSDNDVAVYYRPETGNHLLVGSEDPSCDECVWVDADAFNREFTEQSRTQVTRLAQRIPELPIPSRMKGVVELYDVSDDWIPVYDRSSLAGFYTAIGTSGNQFKNAPVVGEMMAELIAACEAGHDHDHDPVMFRLPHTDRTVSLGFYSRLREVNQNSSFSVLG